MPDVRPPRDLGLMSRAIGDLQIADRRLRDAGFVECAELTRRAVEKARGEFMVAWEAMLRAEGRWSDDETAQRAQMAMARVHLGDV